jgi:hypothetical protein
VGDISDAKYCVLAPRATTFSSYFELAMAQDRPAVNDRFIFESIEAGRIQNPADFAVSSAATPAKKSGRGRKPRTASTSKHVPKKLAVKRELSVEDIASSDSWHDSDNEIAQTPSPPQTPPLYVDDGGRGLYTDQESEYSWHVIRNLARENSDLSIMRAAQSLHEKVLIFALFYAQLYWY